MAVTSDGDVPEIKPLTRKNLTRLNALNGTAEDNNTEMNSAYLFEDDSDDTMKKLSTTDSGSNNGRTRTAS
jgi:hypothetical protein